jgi:hypothetical protein
MIKYAQQFFLQLLNYKENDNDKYKLRLKSPDERIIVDLIYGGGKYLSS